MEGYIEFSYDTIEGKTIEIVGETDFTNAKFKAYNQDGDVINKSELQPIDINNIKEFILDNSIEEIVYESDFYDIMDSEVN